MLLAMNQGASYEVIEGPMDNKAIKVVIDREQAIDQEPWKERWIRKQAIDQGAIDGLGSKGRMKEESK
jgi:hypothetical protein